MATLAAVQSSCAFASPTPSTKLSSGNSRPSALAAVHRSACRWLDAWSGPERVKQHLARHIAARHRTEREPHLLRLAELHQQRSALSISATLADVVASVSAPVSAEPARAWERKQGPSRKPSGIVSLGVA